jgi:hypothetical protein
MTTGEIGKNVTHRFAEFEMCMKWGIAPWDYDRAPLRYRREMLLWFGWRNHRLNEARRVAALDKKHFPNQTKT